MQLHRVTLYFLLLINSSFLWHSLEGAILKSSLESAAVYDQKQYGDYNVRLHLKDFQIVALLSEDVLGALGDDYEELDYQIPEEYLDVQLPTTPNSTSSSESITATSSTVTESKLSSISTTSTTPLPRRTITSRVTTKNPESTTTSTSTANTPSSTTNTAVTKVAATEELSDKNKDETGKIPVFVLQEKSNINNSNNTRKVVSTSVTIMPSRDDSRNKDSQVSLGEILQLKRCPEGYSRDKTGRCRRTRRPQLPFDLSRLTSNLASRFKYVSSTEKSGEQQ